jgi:hypothetical protein
VKQAEISDIMDKRIIFHPYALHKMEMRRIVRANVEETIL